MKFRVSQMATDATLASGQPLDLGGEIELAPEEREHPHNARLIAEGQLIAFSKPDKAREDAETTLESRSKANVTSLSDDTIEPEGGGEQ